MTSSLLNNRYQILQTLGSGGFGTTFLAEDIQMPSHRRCVIKQLRPINNNPEIYKLVQDRFQREAAILEDLGDGNSQIPRLYAYFEEGGEFYLVQEWVEGGTLRDKVQSEGVCTEEAVNQILLNILPVLSYVHGKRIVHRDIKPDNIILRKRDSKPVLIDFGAVRETMGTVVNSQGGSASSIVIGTPGFMPSEQAAGRPMYSSDLYSLGLTMIYLLTGKFPQELDLDPQTGEVIWRRYAPSVGMDLAAVLDKAIQYHPRDRYATAQDMLTALQTMGDFPTIPSLDQLSTNNIVLPTATDTLVQPSISSAEVPATIVQPPTDRTTPQPVDQLGGANAAVTSNPPNAVKEVPDEVPGWNWGGFLLPGLWCINNQVWLGLIAWTGTFTGTLGWWVAAAMMGAKGNEWAWKSRRWRSIEEFKRNQRHWAIGGFITWGSMFMLIVVAAIYGSQMPETKTSSSISPTPSSGNSPSSSEATGTNPFTGAASSGETSSGESSQPASSPVAQSPSPSPTTNAYPDAEVQSYMSNCVSSATNSGATSAQAQSYCTCTLEQLQRKYSFDEFATMVQKYQQTQQIPSEFTEVINYCNANTSQ
ncbi:MAG TPA: serine/threonine-protein kinase [Crinalium sp.]